MTTILVDSKQIQNLEDEIGALTAECDAMRAELELLRANAATDEILLGAAQAAAQRLGTRCEALRADAVANGVLSADAQPKTFVQERAQLEQEWCELRALKQAQQVAVPQEWHEALEEAAGYVHGGSCGEGDGEAKTLRAKIDTLLAAAPHPLRADAERYAAKRKEIFLTNMRMQVSGPRSTEEEFNANYDANCDKAIKGYVTDHRGVLAFNAKMVEPKPPAVICGNCDTALPGGCGGQFSDDGEHCRFGKAAS